MSEKSQPKRTRRDLRRTHPPAMLLTMRDTDILRAVADFKILRQDQLQRLFFGSRSTAQYRLFHLYQHGFLNRSFLAVRSGSSPTLYTLGKRGLELLRAEFGYDETNASAGNGQHGSEYLAHTLAINEVRIAVMQACQRSG